MPPDTPLDRWPASATVDHLIIATEALDLAARTLGMARQAVFEALATVEPAPDDAITTTTEEPRP